jgi:hypothetical protein
MSAKIAAKIAEVMQNVDYLQKDGRVAYGSTRYSYLSEEKITSEMREAMLKAGLVIYPARMEVVNQQDVSTKTGQARVINILVSYRVQDIDSEEFIEVQALGEGMDAGDKAVYKAMTGAFKYAQRQAFMIPTGDDPDKVSSDELTSKGEQEPPTEGSQPEQVDRATQSQLNKIYALVREVGYTPEQMRDLIGSEFGRESSKELTKKEASKLIDMLEKEKAS